MDKTKPLASEAWALRAEDVADYLNHQEGQCWQCKGTAWTMYGTDGFVEVYVFPKFNPTNNEIEANKYQGPVVGATCTNCGTVWFISVTWLHRKITADKALESPGEAG